MAWETYTDQERYEYYYNADSGESTYDKPADAGGDMAYTANPMKPRAASTKSFDYGDDGGPISMASNPMRKAEPAKKEVQMGDLVDVDRVGKGRKGGYERAKIIAVHIGGYEAYRDEEGP